MWICPECRTIYDRPVQVCDRDGAPVAEVHAHQTRSRYPLLGKIVGDRYRLIGGLGQGGLGTVYLAQHRHLGQLFAVKFLDLEALAASTDLEPAQKSAYQKDFLREAQVASLVRHESVVRVSDFGEYEGMPFLVMEFVPGPSLLHVLASRGRFSTGEAIAIARRIAEALDAFHERRLVHRDLKPANVILDPRGDGRLTLVDLGLVKDLSGPAGRASTHPLALRGTPGYLAPEQVPSWVLSGAGVRPTGDKRVVDERADLYALGVIFYEMLAGVSPYPDASNTSVIVYACTRDPVPLDEVVPPLKLPNGLEELILATMHREPEKRPRTAAEFLERLDRVTAGPGERSVWPEVPGTGLRQVDAPNIEAVLAPDGDAGPTPAPLSRVPSLPGLGSVLPGMVELDDSMEETAVFGDREAPASPVRPRSAPVARGAAPSSSVAIDDPLLRRVAQAPDRTLESDLDESMPSQEDLDDPDAVTKVEAVPGGVAEPSTPARPGLRPPADMRPAALRGQGFSSAARPEAPAPRRGVPPLVFVGVALLAGAVLTWFLLPRDPGERPDDREPEVTVIHVGRSDPAAAAAVVEAAVVPARPQDAGVAEAPPRAAPRAPATPRRQPPPGPTLTDADRLLADGNDAWHGRDFRTALAQYEGFLERVDPRHPQYSIVRTRVDYLRRRLRLD